jgi:hypothetical protein
VVVLRQEVAQQLSVFGANGGSSGEDGVSLYPAVIKSGTISLGRWGEIVLTGAQSALLKPTMAEDVALDPEMAEDLTAAVILVNDVAGRLLILAYAAPNVSAVDLRTGTVEPLVTMAREPDFRLRRSSVRGSPDGGVLYLTESDLVYFDSEGQLVWRRSDEFLGWSIEAVTGETVTLGFGDWTGNEVSTTCSLRDGSQVAKSG